MPRLQAGPPPPEPPSPTPFLTTEHSAAELEAAGLTCDLFDEALGDTPLTAANAAEAVVAGCRRRLLLRRRAALEAVREGFAFKRIDLGLQLAAISCRQLLLLVRGRVLLAPADLLGCIDWEASRDAFPADSHVVEWMHELVAAGGLAPAPGASCAGRLLQLLRWCTGKNALPVDGLRTKVVFRCDALCADDHLPEAHTCSHEVELPDYTSLATLRGKLLRALDEMEAGGGFDVQ